MFLSLHRMSDWRRPASLVFAWLGAAVPLIAAASFLVLVYRYTEHHYVQRESYIRVLRKYHPLRENTIVYAVTDPVGKQLRDYGYARGWYEALGEGLVTVFLYVVL